MLKVTPGFDPWTTRLNTSRDTNWAIRYLSKTINIIPYVNLKWKHVWNLKFEILFHILATATMTKKGGRLKIKGDGRKPKKFINKATSFEFKHEVLQHLTSHTMEDTIRKYLHSFVLFSQMVYASIHQGKVHAGSLESTLRFKT